MSLAPPPSPYLYSSQSHSYSPSISSTPHSFLKPSTFILRLRASNKLHFANPPDAATYNTGFFTSGICRFPFPFPTTAIASPSTSFSLNSLPKHTHSIPVSSIETIPKLDKTGRFCSPRAARELALSIVYAACLEASDPVRLFEKRLNARRESGYQFDNTSLMEYNHMSFGGPPVTVETAEEADQLLRKDEKDSAIEAEILAAPPKMVYSKLILRFTRKLLVAVVDRWDSHVLKIENVIPPTWKNKPAGRILELCILHLAMSEITVVGTRHQIVINEAVDLAKRFCDGAAPRIINGCLRTFVKDMKEIESTHAREKQEVVSA